MTGVDRSYGPLTDDEAAWAEAFMEVDLGEVRRQFDAVPVPGLVIGMTPGPHTSSALPMFPWPEGSAGGRLLAMSGMPAAAYLGRLHRTNICEKVYRRAEARNAANRLLAIYRAEIVAGARFVLCGRRVAEAFDLGDAGWFTRASLYGVETVLVPHPSGRCREYNDPAAVARARSAVRWAARWEQGE